MLSTSALATGTIMMPGLALGDDWLGSVSGDWATAGNWTGGAVPTNGTDVLIDAAANSPVVNGTNESARFLRLGIATPNAALDVINAGTLTVTSGADIGLNTAATMVVSGAGSAFAANGYLDVGFGAAGTLDVSGGATLSNTGSAYLGYRALGTGAGTITLGSGSSWTSSDTIYAGYARAGILNVVGGSTAESTGGHVTIGALAGATGTVLVDGSGSTLTAFGTLQVALPGASGTLNVSNGGSAIASDAAIGEGTGSNGTVAVDGAGSSLAVTASELYVGYNAGTGSLTISNGGVVTSKGGRVGVGTDARGSAIITGTGSTWTNTGELSVGRGNDAIGTMTISSGGTVSNTNGYIGYSGGFGDAPSIVSVDGTGSKWTNSGLLGVGYAGNGTLAISNGGKVSAGGGVEVGATSGRTGTVAIDGAGSALTTTALTVGGDGDGSITLNNGGILASGAASIGESSAGAGTVTVDGTGSSWSGGQLSIASKVGSTGSLTITNGGSATHTNVYVAEDTGAVGRINVDGTGSTWGATGILRLGSGASGTLQVTDGAAATNNQVQVGASAGGNGYVLVLGAGSSLNAQTIDLGVSGLSSGGMPAAQGFLTIAQSAGVTVASGLTVGQQGSGEVLVDGAGSSLSVGSALSVGQSEEAGTYGVVTVSNGASLTSNDARLGAYDSGIPSAAGTGSARVDGTGSSWVNATDLTVGLGGDGLLSISNGGSVNNGNDAFVGRTGAGFYGIGTIEVDGAGSTFVNSGDIYVGQETLGQMTVSNGGTVSLGSGRLWFGNQAGSSGQAYIRGQGSSVSANGLIVGNLGQGTLIISDGGTVIGGAGFNSFVGESVGGTGTVTIDGTGSSWTGTDNLFLGRRGTGTLTVSGGGSFSANGLILADDPTGVANLNIGAAAGAPAVEAGAVSAATLAIGDGSGAVNFNHTDANYTFAADISNKNASAAINQISGVTKLTGTSSGFTGTTTVSGGSLYVNGSLGGTINVTGGLLGGSGTVGDVTIGSGGTAAPGNSIGTINVANVTFNSGSVYQVEVDSAGNSDLINATGTAAINGGSVNVVPFPDYALGTTYTIVTAAGGQTGVFDTATFAGGSIFVSPMLSYDANNVYVDLQQTATFNSVALTPNQNAAAAGAQSLGAGNDVFDAIAVLNSAGEARNAFDALSGEIHASAKTAMIEDSRFVREAALDRIRTAFEAAGGAGAGLWMHGFGAHGQIEGDGNAAQLDRTTGGFFIGADGEAPDDWRFGVLAGYSHSSFSVDRRASSGSAESYHLAAYGGTKWNDLAFRFGGAYSWHDIEVGRSVTFTGFSDNLSSDYWAGTGQLFGELAYGLDAGSAHFEPFANLAWVNYRTIGFSEQGGAAALAGADDVTNTAFTTMGLRASKAFGGNDGTKVHVTGMAGWRHAFGDTPTSTLAFAGGNAFTVAGVPLAENTLVLEAGLDFKIMPMAELGFNYSGQIGSGVSDHALKLNLGVKF